ncbi:hypothetical protein F4818DRAFT_390343 [Hypoxylon cercidicola]|nr:hypothetical protein F4818DRAFT_390343 [Hypoxylon cercidicola]
MEPAQSHDSDEHDGSIASSPSPSEEPTIPEPLFARFTDLPPELRHQIWRAALPTPGINFFNVHCIPNDHPDANRSTSPSWLYMDLRRLSIEDDDSTVSEYDPSAWQARSALRAVCREARAVCSLDDSHAATITLTRPRRGLFVRAGDGQLRTLVPAHGGEDAPARLRSGPRLEPLERRYVRVDRNDVLCLSVENCSFSMPFEELPAEQGGGHVGGFRTPRGDFDSDADADAADDEDLGWAYDPQLMPEVPRNIPRSRRCLNLARSGRAVNDSVSWIGVDMLNENPAEPYTPSVMYDAHTRELNDRNPVKFPNRGYEIDDVFWDRFGDRYVRVPYIDKETLETRLTKVRPETNDVRERYLRSASLQSSKRPARSS